MLRILRITGIIVFALFIVLSVNSLREMHESGQLYEPYNSARKSNITLLGVSILMLSGLGYLELLFGRRVASRRGYGGQVYDDKTKMQEGKDASSIYSAPETIDAWQGRGIRNAKSRRKPPAEKGQVWMIILRVTALIFPFYYSGALAKMLMNPDVQNETVWLLPALFLALTLFSLITVIGLLMKRKWGIKLGYALAVLSLMVFPIGTVLGLFLLVGLVGATPLFTASHTHSLGVHRKPVRKAHAKGV